MYVQYSQENYGWNEKVKALDAIWGNIFDNYIMQPVKQCVFAHWLLDN